ncbi:M48 family metallopeptidase [Actinomarinicola tropica]|uniref:M48 family metallopeptidase n=1 Tax=Actinomarinicola tropica TaxID=2789776 RepID=UPI001896C03D|nr:M48 family metallopeptidase [Actinomarinicola tropica]
MTSELSTWRRVPNDPAEWFSDEELDRSRACQRPLTRLRLVRAACGLVGIALVIGLELPQSLVDAVGVSNWVAQLLVVVVLLEVVALVYNPALDWWVDLVHDRRWGLSTQTPGGFVADQVKSLLLGVVVNLALLVPLYAVIRGTDLWWLWGWLLLVGFSVGLGFLYPVVIAPIFNRFEPLEDEILAGRIQEIAERAGVDIEGAFVADESRRSTRDNAYVAGLGATRRVVLYDTILEHPPAVVAQVVAHEVGHWRLGHLRKQIPLAAVLALVLMLGLRLLSEWEGLWSAISVDGLGDPASLPVLLLAVQVGFGTMGLAMSYVSRAFERQADVEALELLGEPELMHDMLRRLHVKNLSDLDPSRWKRAQATHPPAAERMALVREWRRAHHPTPST